MTSSNVFCPRTKEIFKQKTVHSAPVSLVTPQVGKCVCVFQFCLQHAVCECVSLFCSVFEAHVRFTRTMKIQFIRVTHLVFSVSHGNISLYYNNRGKKTCPKTSFRINKYICQSVLQHYEESDCAACLFLTSLPRCGRSAPTLTSTASTLGCKTLQSAPTGVYGAETVPNTKSSGATRTDATRDSVKDDHDPNQRPRTCDLG